jgi:hypothetical protein
MNRLSPFQGSDGEEVYCIAFQGFRSQSLAPPLATFGRPFGTAVEVMRPERPRSSRKNSRATDRVFMFKSMPRRGCVESTEVGA